MSQILKCPFLKYAKKDNISDISNSTIKRLLNLCPHMRTMSQVDQTEVLKEKLSVKIIPEEPVKTVQIKPKINSFNYDEFLNKKLEEKINSNSYRIFKRINRNANSFPIAESYETNVKIDKVQNKKPEKVMVWCSNDYLGLSRHQSVIENAKKVIENYGVGSGGTRNISGNQLLHEQLERKLGDWYQKESGLLFTSCYVANATTLYTLARMLPNCTIISDQGNHASMIEGIRNSRVPKFIYHHNDINHLESILRQIDISIPKIVAFESLNSMNGSIAPIKDLCDVAHNYGAITFIDEVHAVGLYGHNGSGQGELQGVLEHMDIISGTMGKTIGSMGGFIVGNKIILDFIRSYGSGLIFTTSLPPVLSSTAITSIDILQSDEGRLLRSKHQNCVSNLRISLLKNGFPVFDSPSHIIPVHVGNAKICRNISDLLLKKHNMYVQAINYPTVKEGTERLRIAPTPFHKSTDIENLSDALLDTWRSCGQTLLHKKCATHACSCVSKCLSLNPKFTPINCV